MLCLFVHWVIFESTLFNSLTEQKRWPTNKEKCALGPSLVFFPTVCPFSVWWRWHHVAREWWHYVIGDIDTTRSLHLFGCTELPINSILYRLSVNQTPDVFFRQVFLVLVRHHICPIIKPVMDFEISCRSKYSIIIPGSEGKVVMDQCCGKRW